MAKSTGACATGWPVKEKSLCLGVYLDVGLAKASKASELQRDKLDLNLHPSAKCKAEKLKSKQAAANSFQAVVDEWYGKYCIAW